MGDIRTGEMQGSQGKGMGIASEGSERGRADILCLASAFCVV